MIVIAEHVERLAVCLRNSLAVAQIAAHRCDIVFVVVLFTHRMNVSSNISQPLIHDNALKVAFVLECRGNADLKNLGHRFHELRRAVDIKCMHVGAYM